MLGCVTMRGPGGKLIIIEIKTSGRVKPGQALRDACKAFTDTKIGKRILGIYGDITVEFFVNNPPPRDFLLRFGIRRLRVLPIMAHLNADEILAEHVASADDTSMNNGTNS